MGQNAIIPEEPTINTMVIGECGYTDSAAVWLDTDRRCWLNPGNPVSQTPSESATMRVERLGDGLHVWPPSDVKYQPRESTGCVSPGDTAIAVVEVHRD